jgi:hypothetical protein
MQPIPEKRSGRNESYGFLFMNNFLARLLLAILLLVIACSSSVESFDFQVYHIVVGLVGETICVIPKLWQDKIEYG